MILWTRPNNSVLMLITSVCIKGNETMTCLGYLNYAREVQFIAWPHTSI